jgi:lipoprotein-releasing system ATP-binding protein
VSETTTSVLRAAGVRKNYPSGDRVIEVLRGVDIAVAAGESVSIRGESGSGKTTLLNLLAGLDRADGGELYWDEAPVQTLSLARLTARRGRFLGMVFQGHYLIPEIDARANVLMAARMVGRPGRDERARADALLARVGLSDRAHHVPAHLSGGERQRVAIARALMNRPRVILADEPTGNLDEQTGGAVMDLLLDLCAQEQAALILVTHNKDHARRTTRQMFLHLGLLQVLAPAVP